ncbi:MAG: flagellar hook-basal body protein [Candidatus Sericytochromatia bacterium]
MLRGIYTAASNMELSMQKMNLFAQNVANSQTTGYKKKTYAVHSFPDMLVDMSEGEDKAPLAQGSYIDGAGVKQSQGTLKTTGNAMDLAVMGEKIYFQMEVRPPKREDGTVDTAAPKRYTISRNGHFMINDQNEVVNTNGDYLLDVNNRRIVLTDVPVNDPNGVRSRATMPDSAIEIDRFGRIFDRRDKGDPASRVARAQIKMVEWTDAPNVVDDRAQTFELLKKYGVSMPHDNSPLAQVLDPLPAKNTNPGQATELPYLIKQGHLETSNVDIVNEMVMLMMTSKDYDMSQKVIAAEDKILDKSINEMGRMQ